MVFASPSEKVEVVSDKEVFNEQFRRLKKTFRQALTTTVECLKRMPLRGIHGAQTAGRVTAFKRISRVAKAAFLLSNAD